MCLIYKSNKACNVFLLYIGSIQERKSQGYLQTTTEMKQQRLKVAKQH